MATKARIIADLVADMANNQGKALVVNNAGTDLVYSTASFANAGSSEFYGFKFVDTDSDGINEDLQVTTTNGGADNIAITNADNTATDLFDESFFASRNLTFTINQTTGNLEVTV